MTLTQKERRIKGVRTLWKEQLSKELKKERTLEKRNIMAKAMQKNNTEKGHLRKESKRKGQKRKDRSNKGGKKQKSYNIVIFRGLTKLSKPIHFTPFVYIVSVLLLKRILESNH